MPAGVERTIERVDGAEESSLRGRLQVLRRRKWIVIQMVVVVPLVAILFSIVRQPRYEASAGVLLSRPSLVSTLTGTPDPGAYLKPERLMQTEAELALTPVVARRTLAAVGLDSMSPDDLFEASSVTPKPNADLLEFKASNRDPKVAKQLATEYARQFTIYRDEVDSIAVDRARRNLAKRISDLERAGARRLPLYRGLLEKQRDLETVAALGNSSRLVVREADKAVQVAPRTLLAGVFGLALGIVLGTGLAFLMEAFDVRVSSVDEVRRRLGLRLLGKIPEPSRDVVSRDELAVLVDPSSATAEAVRMLRTNIDLINLERRTNINLDSFELQAKSILVTSGVPREWKSTTLANLAVAYAQAGKHVALVDLDVRQPTLHRFFHIPLEQPSLTDVVLGHAKLEEALYGVVFRETDVTLEQRVNGGLKIEGALRLLACESPPPNPGEFVASRQVEEILAELRDRFDLILIDSPPVLSFSDALALSANVDGILVVTRLNFVRRATLDEVRRALDASAAPLLGVALAGVEIDGGYGDSYTRYRRWRMSRTRASDRYNIARSLPTERVPTKRPDGGQQPPAGKGQ
jgi:capsular exopolysaccharide synthesis family protein